MKTFHQNLLFLVLGLLLIGGLLALPAWRWSKDLRAHLLAEKAEEAYLEGAYRDAFNHAVSAAAMAPGDIELELLRARTALKLEGRNPFRLWEPLLDHPEVTADQLVELAERMRELQSDPALHRILPELLRRDPASPRGRELYLEALARDFRFETVAQLGEKWIAEGSDRWPLHRLYTEALLNFPDPAKQRRALEHLEELSTRPDELGLHALRRRLSLPHEPEQARTWIERLEAHPLVEDRDRVLALGWRYRREGSLSFESAHERVRSLLDLEDPEERVEYYRWLASMERHDLLLEELEPEAARSTPELARLRLNALIEDGRAEEVVRMTLDPSSGFPLSEASVLVLRARALAALGQQEELEETLALAVQLSTLDDFGELERELARLGRSEELGTLYWRLMENRATERFAGGRLLFSTYFHQDETGLIAALAEIDPGAFEADPNFLCFVAYLKLLYEPEERLEAAHMVEDLMAEHPNLYDFRIILGLAHLLRGNGALVQRLLPSIPAELPARQPRYLRVAHHVLTHMGEDPAVARAAMAEKLPFEALLPRERALLLGSVRE